MAERRCSRHACVQHSDCRVVTERCGCPECRQELAAGGVPAPGDIVTLHSGGPDLTVLRVHDDGGRVADLGWFTAAGEYRTGTLPLSVLRPSGSATSSKPPRTGYRDLRTGVYHPGPSYVGFDAHANACGPCAALRLVADDYIDRRSPRNAGPRVGSEPCDYAPRNAHLWPGGRIPGR